MKKIYLGFLVPFYLYGQNLNQLVDSSLQNQLVASTKQNITSLQSQYKSVQNSYMPSLTVGANYSNTNEETAAVANSSIVGYAKINYVLYDGGKKGARFNAFKSNINSANMSLEALKNNISIQVVNYYFNYHSLLAQKEAKHQEITQLNAQYNRLVKFMDAGTATSDEIDKIKSRVENANVTLHEIELNLQNILHNLEYITAQNVTIESGSTIKDVQGKKENLRSDIKALEFDMKKILADARATKSSNFPMVSLDNTLNYYDMNYDNPAFDNGVDSQNVFKLNLSWKLYDFDATNSAYQSIYKQYKSLKSKYEYEKNKASIDLKLAIKSYNIAKLKIDSATSALKAATSTYETIQAKYQNGLVDNVAYLESLSERFSALGVLKSAKYDLEIKKANIIYYSGKNVWEYIK